MTKKLLMGNEAMAHAALEAGVGVVAGYPGTPSSEIVETVAKLHASGAAQGVHVEWSTNEKVALEMLFGASLAGARCLFTCKQMGLNVASDALMSLNYVSVRGGLVLIVADDPGPISSQTEQDTRRFAAFAKVPVLDPASPEQAFSMVQAAFELSERFHTPVIVRPTTRVDHASAFFDVSDETSALPLPESGFEHDPSKWVIFPRRAYQAHGEINERIAQIAHVFATEETFATFNEMDDADGAAFGIIAGGVSAAYAREALGMVKKRTQAAGIHMPACRFMQIGTPYPFPEEALTPFMRGLTDVLVVEELDYVLEDELAKWAGRTHTLVNIHGKLNGAARDRGENDVDDIAQRIERFMGLSGRLRIHRSADTASDTAAEVPADSLPVRPPVLCAGCPHRGTFYAVKKALGKTPAVLCGDIGCYTLGNAKPLEAVDTCLCMGAGITMAQGFAVADPGKKAIAYVGDSTFFASGMTGLANAAYNGHDITVMVLDNATTAMTGSQPHPGTGVTLMGERREPLSIDAALAANGFSRVFHANPLDKDGSIVAVKAALAHVGPSAVVFQSPCIQLIKPDTPAVINAERCTGCKKCITEIGCPAIGFNPSAGGMRSGDRGQAVIDESLCDGCGLCTQVCPFKAISTMSAGDTVAFPPIDHITEEYPEELPPAGKHVGKHASHKSEAWLLDDELGFEEPAAGRASGAGELAAAGAAAGGALAGAGAAAGGALTGDGNDAWAADESEGAAQAADESGSGNLAADEREEAAKGLSQGAELDGAAEELPNADEAASEGEELPLGKHLSRGIGKLAFAGKLASRAAEKAAEKIGIATKLAARESEEQPPANEQPEAKPVEFVPLQPFEANEEAGFIPLEPYEANDSEAFEPFETDESEAFDPFDENDIPAGETAAFPPIDEPADKADSQEEALPEDSLETSTAAVPENETDSAEENSNDNVEDFEDDMLSASETVAFPPIAGPADETAEDAEAWLDGDTVASPEDDALSASDTVAFPPIDALSASDTVALPPIGLDSADAEEVQGPFDPFSPSSEGPVTEGGRND